MFQRRLPHRMAGNRRCVDILLALFLVPDVSLLLENAQLRPDRGLSRLTRQFGQNLCDRGASQAVDNVHDLTFAPAQARVKSF